MSLPEPNERLPRAAVGLWRLVLGLWTAAAVVASFVFSSAADGLGLPSWSFALIVLAGGIVAVIAIPRVRWQRWRYEIREDEIDLRSGLITIRRTLVPIRRIQHVDTESGLLQTFFDLATVTFHTAAGETEIPALTRADAEAVRRRVGELAKTHDDV